MSTQLVRCYIKTEKMILTACVDKWTINSYVTVTIKMYRVCMCTNVLCGQ